MAKPSKPKVADCRRCRWRGEVVRGVSVECVTFGFPIEWDLALAGTACEDFRARPVRRKAKGGAKR